MRCLAFQIVSQSRGTALSAPALQGAVLLCHAFARLARRRDEQKRVRVLAFDIARRRPVAEPALFAALCVAWPAPFALASHAHADGQPLLVAIAA